MLMHFRGGGVGHTGTRAATNKFLQDRDRLDLDISTIEGSDSEDEVDEQDSDHGNDLGDGGSDDEVLGLRGSDDDEGVTPDLDNGEGSGDEEEDYGYGYFVDEEDGEDGNELDIADDALGPEDGDGDVDEVNLLGFAAF